MSRQKGAVLLLALLVLLTATASVVIAGLNSAIVQQPRQEIDAQVLAKAREALIGWSAGKGNNANTHRPGSLPCPDTNDDGFAQGFTSSGTSSGNCNGGALSPLTGYVGRLPWRTLGIEELRDSAGETLWYAVSQSFRDHNSAQPINSDTLGLFAVNGDISASQVIAVVFVPGQALVGQQRATAAQKNNKINYLDGENNNNNNIFTTVAPTATFNDRLTLITSENLMPPVEMRVAGELRSRLRTYRAANGYFPYAASLDDANYLCEANRLQGHVPVQVSVDPLAPCGNASPWGIAFPPWLIANQWHRLAYYSIACSNAQNPAGCGGGPSITILNGAIPNNKEALVIMAGKNLSSVPSLGGGSQIPRPAPGAPGSNNPAIYLDTLENSNNDSVFETKHAATNFNDVISVVAPP